MIEILCPKQLEQALISQLKKICKNWPATEIFRFKCVESNVRGYLFHIESNQIFNIENESLEYKEGPVRVESETKIHISESQESEIQRICKETWYIIRYIDRYQITILDHYDSRYIRKSGILLRAILEFFESKQYDKGFEQYTKRIPYLDLLSKLKRWKNLSTHEYDTIWYIALALCVNYKYRARDISLKKVIERAIALYLEIISTAMSMHLPWDMVDDTEMLYLWDDIKTYYYEEDLEIFQDVIPGESNPLRAIWCRALIIIQSERRKDMY